MIPARALTLCVGISAYPPDVLQPEENPLRYLANSARTLSEIFRGIWPGHDSTHRLAVDAAATRDGVRSLIADDERQYDLLVVYLGGHGRGGRHPFQFVFSGASATEAIAHASDIDTLVAPVKATHVLVLLDACHAGAYAQESAFFRALPGAGTRLCIASSLADQKSWEDSHFRLSIFAHALIKALTDRGGDGAPKRVTTELFEEISRDVVQHAFALKRSAAQEPLMVGAVSTPLSLPSAAAGPSRVRSMTLYEVLLRRTRQVAAVVVFGALLSALALSLLTWRPAMNQPGRIELRAGPKWLSPLNVGWWQRRVELELTIDDLRDAEPVRAALLDERGTYLWPGMNPVGQRRWADMFVDDFLNAVTSARWRVRLGYPDGVARLTTVRPPGGGGGGGLRVLSVTPTTVVTVYTATELAAEAKMLRPSAPLGDAWQAQWQQYVALGTCRQEPGPETSIDGLRLYLDLSEPTRYARWLRGLALTAEADDVVGFDHVARLVEMFTAARRLTGRPPAEAPTEARVRANSGSQELRPPARPSAAELGTLMSVSAAIVARRTTMSRPPVKPEEQSRLKALMMDGCADVAAPVLAVLGRHGDPTRVFDWARGRPGADESLAALRELAIRGEMPDERMSGVLDDLGFARGAADHQQGFARSRPWLAAIGEIRQLPPVVAQRLADYALDRFAVGDVYGARQALTLLPVGVVDGPRAHALRSSLATQRTSLPLGFGDLGDVELHARLGSGLSAEQRELLTSVLEESPGAGRRRVVFADADKNENGDVIPLVAGLGFRHLLAFARFTIVAADSGLLHDRRTVPFLEGAVADAIRFGIRPHRLRDVIVAATIARRSALSAADVHHAIRQSRDAADRRTHIELGSAALLIMSHARRTRTLNELRDVWNRESEPEIKVALAEVVIRGASEAERWSIPDSIPRWP